MPIPRFLYFDLGNVLFTFDQPRVCRQVAAVARLPVGDVEAFLSDGYQNALESGKTTIQQVYDRFCQQFSVSPKIEDIARAASDIFQLNDSIVPLLTRLAMSNQRLGILSNTNAPHWEFLNSQDYAILDGIFELTVLSYEVQVMKPAAGIYAVAAERTSIPPGEIFFTDDRLENVQAAVSAGWQAVQFENAHQLEEELRSRGVEFN